MDKTIRVRDSVPDWQDRVVKSTAWFEWNGDEYSRSLREFQFFHASPAMFQLRFAEFFYATPVEFPLAGSRVF